MVKSHEQRLKITPSENLLNNKLCFVFITAAEATIRDMNKMSKTATFVKRYREKQGITQAELAERMKVSVTAVQNWESGKTRISQKHHERLAEIFSISLDTLLREMAADMECGSNSSWPGFLFEDELNSIIDGLHLSLEQQDLFGCLHIYGARFLNEDELATEVIADMDAGSREETERRIFTEDLRLIPFDFINRVGSINFLNHAEKLFEVIRYIKPEFLLKVLKLNPDREFNLKKLSKELIAEFIDSGLKDWVKDGREFDFTVNISMFKARIMLQLLNKTEGRIRLADGNSNQIRDDLPDGIRETLLKMLRITHEEWEHEKDRPPIERLRYNVYAVIDDLDTVTYYQNNAGKDTHECWLRINDRGRQLLEWFSE